jgi:hypothetical protein
LVGKEVGQPQNRLTNGSRTAGPKAVGDTDVIAYFPVGRHLRSIDEVRPGLLLR